MILSMQLWWPGMVALGMHAQLITRYTLALNYTLYGRDQNLSQEKYPGVQGLSYIWKKCWLTLRSVGHRQYTQLHSLWICKQALLAGKSSDSIRKTLHGYRSSGKGLVALSKRKNLNYPFFKIAGTWQLDFYDNTRHRQARRIRRYPRSWIALWPI